MPDRDAFELLQKCMVDRLQEEIDKLQESKDKLQALCFSFDVERKEPHVETV
jgi:hypothetical protein